MILDLLIKQEALAEVSDLPSDKLVQLVHNIAQDTDSVLANVVDHLLDTDCL